MLRRQILFAILFLFFFQLLAEFVAAIYAFGLLGTSIPAEMVAVLLFFSPLLLLLWRRPLPLRLLLLLFLLSRVVLPFFSTRGRLLVAGAGVALFLLWLPSWLASRARPRPKVAAAILGPALLLATGASALLRALGMGIDATTAGHLDLIAWLLAALAVVLLFRSETAIGEVEPVRGGGWPVLLLVGGLFAVFILVYFTLLAPHVVARWVDVPLSLVLGLLAISLPVWALLFIAPLPAALTPRLLALLTLLLTLALALALRGQQIAFPATPDAYPLAPAPAPAWQLLPLALFLLLAPVLFVDAGLLLETMLARDPGRPLLAAAFSAGSLFLLLMIFAQVFTTVYDYIPLAGPWFRDRYWLVVPFPGLVVVLALLVSARPAPRPRVSRAWLLPLLALLLGGGSLLAASLAPARPDVASPSATLRVLTYNIQQGYNAAGQRAYRQQLDVMREAAPDLIGLQESDTARIATGNDDLVAYFAGELGYHAYYGPSPVAGTFGLALLSRYPLQDPYTFYMYSEGEQTATIAATVQTETGPCRLYVTHLGNGGPQVQLEAILAKLGVTENVFLMGDFNFRPETEQYALATASLVDAWEMGDPQEAPPVFDPARRIDHIFVSPDVTVEDVRYLPPVASDHPPLLATVRCPAAE